MSSRFSRYGFTERNHNIIFMRVGTNTVQEERKNSERASEHTNGNGNNSTNNKTSNQWYLFSIMNTDRPFLGALPNAMVAVRERARAGSLFASLSSLCLIFFARLQPEPVRQISMAFILRCGCFSPGLPLSLTSVVIAITRIKFEYIHTQREKNLC